MKFLEMAFVPQYWDFEYAINTHLQQKIKNKSHSDSLCRPTQCKKCHTHRVDSVLKKMIINTKEFIMVNFPPLYTRTRSVDKQVKIWSFTTKNIKRGQSCKIKMLWDFWNLERSLVHTQTSELTVSYAHCQRQVHIGCIYTMQHFF